MVQKKLRYGIEISLLFTSTAAAHKKLWRLFCGNRRVRPPYGQRCTDACRASLTAMRDAFDWDLSRAEMAQLDRLAFDAYPQSPTYYSSAGCPNSFGVSDHPTKSPCGTTKAAWC